jgi:hypothetical protein
MGKQPWCWLAIQNIKVEMTKEANQKDKHKRRKTPKEPPTEGGRGEKQHRTVST